MTPLTGVEVFRLVYEAVGLGWLFRFTRIPWLGYRAEKVYDFWARHRMRITGRPDLEEIFEERRRKKLGDCQNDRCATKLKP